MKKIKIVSCTQKKDYKDTDLYKSIQKLQTAIGIQYDDVNFYTENKEGLSKRYNQYLKENDNNNSIIVFIHDDVILEDAMMVTKLCHYHDKYDIIGVAGGINMQIKQPALWHIMCGGFGPNLRGFAGHAIDNSDQCFVTNFGPTPARVNVIDGLFMSVNVDTIKSKNWQFNENYSFHHYDIASCLDANTKRLKIGVVPIWVTHRSHGLREYDSVFIESQKTFLEEYKNY
jgi:hypothetical protein